MRLLVIEDNEQLISLLAQAVAHVGLDADSVRNAGDAETMLRTVRYAAVVLDLGLPDADGLTVLENMRRRRDDTPVLVLSARGGLDDRVKGLHKGASDYLVKPFAMEELLARLQALLRRPPLPHGQVLRLGNLSFQTEGRLATVGGKPVTLPLREGDVLEVLLRRSGRVVSHESLRAQVFGAAHDVASNAIEVYVHRLRRMLAEAGANLRIHTIRGVGYLVAVEKTSTTAG